MRTRGVSETRHSWQIAAFSHVVDEYGLRISLFGKVGDRMRDLRQKRRKAIAAGAFVE